MQTYTHLAVGLALSQFFPNNTAKLVVIGITTLPDIPLYYEFAKDRLQGRPPFSKMSPGFKTINEAFHSLVMWFPTIFFLPAFIGVYSHLILDVISHRDWPETFPGWLWPVPYKLKAALFEYRTEIGKLITPLDFIFTGAGLLFFFIPILL